MLSRRVPPKINAFLGCKQQSPLRGRGSLWLSTSTIAAPHTCPPHRQQQFWGGLPGLCQPRREQRSPTTSTPAEPSSLAKSPQALLHPTSPVLGVISELSRLQKSSGRIKSNGEYGHSLHKPCFIEEEEEEAESSGEERWQSIAWRAQPLSSTRFGFTGRAWPLKRCSSYGPAWPAGLPTLGQNMPF